MPTDKILALCKRGLRTSQNKRGHGEGCTPKFIICSLSELMQAGSYVAFKLVQKICLHIHTHTQPHTLPPSILAWLSSLQKLQGNKGVIDSIMTETRRLCVCVCVCVCMWCGGVNPQHTRCFIPLLSISFCPSAASFSH